MALPNDNMNFVALDELSAEEMNDLVENIEALADGSGLEDGSVGQSALADKLNWQEAGRTTLGSAGDSISVTGLEHFKFLWIIFRTTTTGTVRHTINFNNDTANNYAQDRFNDQTGEATEIGFLAFDNNTSRPYHFGEYVTSNETSEEKVGVGTIAGVVAGAANAPSNIAISGKWANTSDAITRVDLNNTSSGDYEAGSELLVLGRN